MEGKDGLDLRGIAADISEDEHILQVSEENEVDSNRPHSSEKVTMRDQDVGISSKGDDKDIWRNIFFTISSGIAGKTIKTITGNEPENKSDSNPQIDIKRLVNFLHTRTLSSKKLEEETGLPRHQLAYMASSLARKGDKNKDGKISLEEWEEWIQSKSGKEFLTRHRYADGFMRVMAYSPSYSCNPPKLFILSISIIQTAIYLVSMYSPESLGMPKAGDEGNMVNNEIQNLQCSDLIVNPVKRKEIWRFVTYTFLHANHQHIGFNLLMQLMIGIPLEIGQPGWLGSLRVAALYFSGVLLGSVGASCIQPNMFLVGASAGVYALIAAHLATLVLNWNEDGMIYRKKSTAPEAIETCEKSGDIQVNKMVAPSHLNPYIRGLRLGFVLLFCFIDIGYALYLHYVKNLSTTTSYAGHGCGALAGVLIGIFILKNRKVDDWEIIVQSVAFVVYGLIFCMFVAWQIAGTPTFWFPPSKREVSGGEEIDVPPEILGYCKTCYNKTYVDIHEECPDFW